MAHFCLPVIKKSLTNRRSCRAGHPLRRTARRHVDTGLVSFLFHGVEHWKTMERFGLILIAKIMVLCSDFQSELMFNGKLCAPSECIEASGRVMPGMIYVATKNMTTG